MLLTKVRRLAAKETLELLVHFKLKSLGVWGQILFSVQLSGCALSDMLVAAAKCYGKCVSKQLNCNNGKLKPK